MYLGLDGTGVPVRQTERAGRAGKQPDGTAKTREAKLVLVWTAETRNPQGRPVRDPGSVSYSGAIESAASRDTDPDLSAFAQRVRREAERRGFPNAARRVVLGDGAAWIWNLSSEQFPGAIQIVDLWHAKEHLWEVSKVHAGDPGRVEAWARARCHELEAGSLDNLLQVLRSRADQCESAPVRRLRRAQPPQDALRGVPRAGPVCGFRSGRGGLQDGDRHAIEKGRDALDRRRGQRHHRPALLQAQRSLRGLLGKPVTQFMRSSQNHVVRPGRFFKKPDAADLARMADAARQWEQIEPRFVPDQHIPTGDETARLHRWGYNRYREMFNTRQLLGLELSCRLIAETKDERVRHALATNLSDLLRYQNMLCRYDTMSLKSLDIFSVHGFPVGLVQCESNLLGITNSVGLSVGSGGWSNIVNKYVKAKRYCEAPYEVRHTGSGKVRVPIEGEQIGETRNGARRKISIRCSSATEIEFAPDSLDGVFTDPPYFGNVQYGELMDFCYVWLRRLVG